MMRNLLTTCLLATALAVPLAAQRNCTTANYGASCGPVLTHNVTPTGNTFRVTLTVKGKPNTTVLFMVGAVKLDISLHPYFGGSPSCRLLLNPVFIQFHRTDNKGFYTIARAVGDFVGTAHVQFAEVCVPTTGPVTVKTTQGVTINCTK